MAKIDSAYDYYVSVYGNEQTTRYDSHKKSDLRKVYNSIVKTNKDSPLYKISNLDSAKRYAIDIKQNAKSIQNVVASLSDDYGEFGDSFQKKVAISSDEDTVTATYVGDGKEKNSANEFDIVVNHLATPQVNTGNYLRSDAISFVPGDYSFDLNTTNSAYEFQFHVAPGETNEEIQTKLSRLINDSNLGLTSEILDNGEGATALSIISNETGLTPDENYLFSISPAGDQDSMSAMGLLGIHHVTAAATNSDFTLNGTQQSSLSNTFTINNAFELTLKQESPEGEPTTISFKANTDAVADNVQTLVDAYNNILSIAEQNADTAEEEGAQGRRLLSDMSSVSLNHKSDLESVGLMVADNGSVSIDRDILADALVPARQDDTFQILTSFKDNIGSKANAASINPMKYVNKVIVEYKNPGKNFNTPYVSSIYSGMMLDDYI